MRIIIFFVCIVAVVCSDCIDFVFIGKAQEKFINLVLLFDLVSLKLYKIIISKNIEPPAKLFFCFNFTLVQKQLWYMCTYATGSCYQTFMVFFNQFFINSWILAINALRIA